MASVSGEWQAVQIIRLTQAPARADIRPLVRLIGLGVLAQDGDRMESGSHGRATNKLSDIPIRTIGADMQTKARQALLNLESVPAPAGEMTVVLGPGWPGILPHEAIGHGLKATSTARRTSAFAGLMGERVASSGVTVDDGTIHDRRGSLSIDDEGTPTKSTTLIEDGILVGYMQDRMNARLMDMAATGNGRRYLRTCTDAAHDQYYLHVGG